MKALSKEEFKSNLKEAIRAKKHDADTDYFLYLKSNLSKCKGMRKKA